MADGPRSLQEVCDAFKACTGPEYYNQWAETYEADQHMMEYAAPAHIAHTLMKHVPHGQDQLRVLDVACGSGLVAKLLSSLGFRHFVGVDVSDAMLEKARKTALYQDLYQAVLGTQALPVGAEQFDVVTIAGALYPEYVPVKVVRELCHAAKPGGLVVLTRGNYQTPERLLYTQDLHLELGSMEQEGLWKCLEVRPVERYLRDPHQPQSFIQGSVYIYQKC